MVSKASGDAACSPKWSMRADLRQARPLRLARLVPPLRPAPPAPVVLRHEALELLRPDPADRRRRSARSSGSTSLSGLRRSARSSRRSSRHPALYDGPRMVKPPVVYVAGLLRALEPRDRHRGLDVADEPRRPAALLPAERRGLGRHALARHRDLPRPLVIAVARDPAARSSKRDKAKLAADAAKLLAPRARRSRQARAHRPHARAS